MSYSFKFESIPACHLNYSGDTSFKHKLKFWLLMPNGNRIGLRLMTKWNEWSFAFYLFCTFEQVKVSKAKYYADLIRIPSYIQ